MNEQQKPRDPRELFVEEYFGQEFKNEKDVITTDFGHIVNIMAMWEERLRDPMLAEVRDLLRFMFIDRQHNEIIRVHEMNKQQLHKNKHGIRENKAFRESNEDLAALQNYVSLVGTDIMTKYAPLFGGELNYIKNLRELIQRSLDKQATMTDSQKASEVDSTQPPSMIIQP